MPAEPFPDNWTYLKTELAWLDRLLSLAVAQQRKDTKEVNQLARSTADRVTSHWWKGLVTLEGDISSDSPVDIPRRKPTAKGSHQQQMAARILASQQQGIRLGIPLLSDRLQLTPFERTLVLLALAPEINRRYGRLYNYLQNIEQSNAPGLPTVDLILRLCCRTEAEWRSARQCFTTSPLIHHHLLELPSTQPESLLTRPVKLSDALVTYLLSEQPAASRLDTLLPSSPCLLHTQDPAPTSPTPWSSLVLPPSLLMALQHLCHRVHAAAQVDRALGSSTAGRIALLVGAAGTGKTAAANAIAQALQTSLVWADLALLSPADHPRLLAEILHQDPTLLLLKSAHLWLKRTPLLENSAITQFWQHRQQTCRITLLSVTHVQTVRPYWRQMSQLLEFPVPDVPSRLQLWQQAIPAQMDASIDWNWLARRHVLTGGEIRAIVRDAIVAATAESPDAPLELRHIQYALSLRSRGRSTRF